jgi:hypothetical protein
MQENTLPFGCLNLPLVLKTKELSESRQKCVDQIFATADGLHHQNMANRSSFNLYYY